MPKVFIRRDSDGAVRTHDDLPPWQDHSEYMWSGGNYGCDCNRGIFFGCETDVDCGETKFSVRIEDNDGKVLFQDDRWEAGHRYIDFDHATSADKERAKLAAEREGWRQRGFMYAHPSGKSYLVKDMDGWIDLCDIEGIEF